jgi:hypothetical protein
MRGEEASTNSGRGHGGAKRRGNPSGSGKGGGRSSKSGIPFPQAIDAKRGKANFPSIVEFARRCRDQTPIMNGLEKSIIDTGHIFKEICVLKLRPSRGRADLWRRIMALKQCFECKGAVSTEARSCPHCGALSPTRTRLRPEAVQKLITVILVVGWPLFIIAFLIQAAHNPTGFYH